MDDEFAALTRRLGASTDPYEQGEVANAVYDAWFKRAAAYAKSVGSAAQLGPCDAVREIAAATRAALSVLSGGDAEPSVLLEADDFVANSLLEAFAKVLSLLRTKPKFLHVSASADGAPLTDWLEGAALRRLEGVAYAPHARSTNRTAALRALVPLLELGAAVREQRAAGAAGAAGAAPAASSARGIDLRLEPLVALALGASSEYMLVQAALELLRAHARLLDAAPAGADASARERLLTLVARALTPTDDAGGVLRLFWSLRALESEAAVRELVARLDAERGPSAANSAANSAELAQIAGTRALDGSRGAPAPRSLARAVLESLNEYARDVETELSAREAERTRAHLCQLLDVSCAAVHRHATGTAAASGGGGGSLLAAATSAARAALGGGARGSEEGLGAEYEHPAVALELLDALLLATAGSPDACAPFLAWALDARARTPGTLGCVSGGPVRLYRARVWLERLLPFVEARLVRMSLHGVSGDQSEQAVVDLLHDGVRAWYSGHGGTAGSASAAAPSAALGAALVHAMLEAMRRGYVETERFPMYAAIVIGAHASSGSLAWLGAALSPEVCHTHKVTRAVTEVALRLLGASVVGDVDDSRVGVVSAAQRAEVLRVVATAGSAAGFATLAQLAKADAALLLGIDGGLQVAVAGADARLRAMAKVQQRWTAELDAMSDFFTALAPHASAEDAVTLLDAWLRAAAVALRAPDDDVFASLLQRAPTAAPPPLALAVEALRVCGEHTCCAIAALYPTLCLADSSSTVRAAALSALAGFPALVQQHAALVLSATETPSSRARDWSGCPRECRLDELELALAGAPSLGLLGATHAAALPAALSRLASYVALTALNDAQSAPADVVLDALRRVACEADPAALGEHLRTAAGARDLGEIGRGLAEWPALARARAAAAAEHARTTQPLLAHSTPVALGTPVAIAAPLGRAAEPAAPSAAAKAQVTSAGTASAAAEPALKQRPAVASSAPALAASAGARGAPADERARSLLDEARAFAQAGQPVAAMRSCARARATDASAFALGGGAELVSGTVLPALRDTCLPAPAPAAAAASARGKPGTVPAYSESQLARYDAHVSLLREARALFPAEAEAVLQPAARMADLAAAAVEHKLARGDAAGARLWMTKKGVHAPSLAARVAEAERGAAPEAAAPRAAAPNAAAASAASALASAASATARAVRNATAARPRAQGPPEYAQLSSLEDMLLALPPVPPDAPASVSAGPARASTRAPSRWAAVEPAAPRAQLPPLSAAALPRRLEPGEESTDAESGPLLA